jgi:hypothetical protein
MKTAQYRMYPHDIGLVKAEVVRLRRTGKYQPPMPNGADVIAWCVRAKLEKKADAETDCHGGKE